MFVQGGDALTAAEICVHRLSIITGHYGTGKTEFAVNLALALAAGPHETYPDAAELFRALDA